jgi:hypothetical protein
MVPRLDFSYALKPKKSGSDAMRLFTRDYGIIKRQRVYYFIYYY